MNIDTLDEILDEPDSVELVEYELSDALKDQGVRPNVYPKLTAKAKQALNLYIEEKIKDELNALLKKQYFAEGYGYDHGQVVDVIEIEDRIKELEQLKDSKGKE